MIAAPAALAVSIAPAIPSSTETKRVRPTATACAASSGHSAL